MARPRRGSCYAEWSAVWRGALPVLPPAAAHTPSLRRACCCRNALGCSPQYGAWTRVYGAMIPWGQLKWRCLCLGLMRHACAHRTRWPTWTWRRSRGAPTATCRRAARHCNTPPRLPRFEPRTLRCSQLPACCGARALPLSHIGEEHGQRVVSQLTGRARPCRCPCSTPLATACRMRRSHTPASRPRPQPMAPHRATASRSPSPTQASGPAAEQVPQRRCTGARGLINVAGMLH